MTKIPDFITTAKEEGVMYSELAADLTLLLYQGAVALAETCLSTADRRD